MEEQDLKGQMSHKKGDESNKPMRNKGKSLDFKPVPQFVTVSGFDWTPERDLAAEMLALGYTIRETAEKCEVTERTIYNWKANDQFMQEVDRLAVTSGIANKANRMIILNRMIREFVKNDGIKLHDESLLDLLKEARMQSEGTKLDLTAAYTALSEENRSLAYKGPAGTSQGDGTKQDSTE